MEEQSTKQVKSVSSRDHMVVQFGLRVNSPAAQVAVRLLGGGYYAGYGLHRRQHTITIGKLAGWCSQAGTPRPRHAPGQARPSGRGSTHLTPQSPPSLLGQLRPSRKLAAGAALIQIIRKDAQRDMAARETYNTRSYVLPLHERIRLLENNIKVFEQNDCPKMAQKLSYQLAVLRQDRADGREQERHW